MTWQPYLTWQPGPGNRLTWQGSDVARGTTAPLRRGTEATWQDACGPRGVRACGADVWSGATRTGHANAREGRHVATGAGKWRAHGLVGPG